MTDATELKKIVKQLQSASTEPVIDLFFLVSMSFVYVVQADVPIFSSFLLTGNHRYSPCHEEEFPSERGRPQSGIIFFRSLSLSFGCSHTSIRKARQVLQSESCELIIKRPSPTSPRR